MNYHRQTNNCLGAVIFFCLLIILTGSAIAKEVSSVSVKAPALVPGEETRYIIKWHTDAPLNISAGSSATVYFPPGFRFICGANMAANPGCTLARIEYKNPGDKLYAVVRGTVQLAGKEGSEFIFTPRTEHLIIPENIDVYLIVPGVINTATTGHQSLTLLIRDANGAEYRNIADFTLGLPSAAAPRKVKLEEATSYKVRLAWEPVNAATHYKVVFAVQPEGEYISALDFGREPAPGEEWQLTETNHSFTGRGNGGLIPGETYYFKVLAGNESGFGIGSPVLRVTTPAVKLRESRSPDREPIVVPCGKAQVIALDQPVKIAEPDGVRIYDQISGLRVKEVRAIVDETDKRIVRVDAKLQPGREYLVVFYEGALESARRPEVVNNTFGWKITVTGKK